MTNVLYHYTLNNNHDCVHCRYIGYMRRLKDGGPWHCPNCGGNPYYTDQPPPKKHKEKPVTKKTTLSAEMARTDFYTIGAVFSEGAQVYTYKVRKTEVSDVKVGDNVWVVDPNTRDVTALNAKLTNAKVVRVDETPQLVDGVDYKWIVGKDSEVIGFYLAMVDQDKKIEAALETLERALERESFHEKLKRAKTQLSPEELKLITDALQLKS